MGKLRGIVIVGLVSAVVAGLAGCASAGERRLEGTLRGNAAAAAAHAGYVVEEPGLEDPTDAIGAYGRRILPQLEGTGVGAIDPAGFSQGSPDSAGPLRLVGIEPYADADWGDPVGALVLASRLDVVSEDLERDVCFRIVFDRWGVVEDGIDDVGCPDPLVDVEPPADVRAIIPEGAAPVVLAVLDAAGAAGADELVDRITAELQPLTGGRALATVRAVREGDRIGVAMSDVDDCLLARVDGGPAEELHVPGILLQPGELGCSAETALLPDESFRAPH